MWTIPREVSGIPTQETFTLLLLVVIHGLCHPHGQPLYVVWFRWSILNWIRIWWQQVWFYCSHVPHRCRILLEAPVGVVG